ncbi:MAG: glycosyltransferase family 4 protein [Pseudomonadota bacterium]
MLQLVPRLDEGGVERGTVEIAAAIRAAGGRALVASAGGRLERSVARAGGEHIAGPFAAKGPLAIRANAGRIAALVRAEGVEVIHARSRAPAWAGWWAARQTGAAFVTTFHGVYSEGLPGKRLYNSVMARGRPTIAISHFVADHIRARYQVPEAMLRVIPRGADLADFDEASVAAGRAASVAAAWGLADDTRPIVLMPARLGGWKGHDHVVAAARILRQRGQVDPLFIMAGEGPEAADNITAAAAEAGVADAIRLVGHCSDMAAAYKLSAVVLSAATRPEAFGRVPIEAQAMGRPVIASDHGGPRETVDHGKSGWLYPPGDAEALAAAIETVLSLDDSGRAHMGLAGRARVRAQFSLKAMQQATLEIYEEVTGRSFPSTLG